MKTVISLWLAAVVAVCGQGLEPDKIGFIRLVNAVAPGEGEVELLLDGSNLYPDGYRFGAVTGGIGVDPGQCKVLVRKQGVKDGETKVDVGIGQTTTVIPFAERIPATDEEPAHWQIRILRLKQTEKPEGRQATFISVASAPVIEIEMRDPDGNWDRFTLKRFRTTRAPMKYPRGYVPLRIGKAKLPPIPVMDVGNYVVVVYDDPEGKVAALSFRDFMHVTAE